MRKSACREFLAEAIGGSMGSGCQHELICPTCRADLDRVRKLAAVLECKPVAPPELLARSFLLGVYERAVGGLEAGAEGALVRQAMQEAPPLVDKDDRRLEHLRLDAVLAVPASMRPSPQHWLRIRSDLLVGARGHSAIARRLGAIALLGLAASILVYFAGPDEPRASMPEIVFVDLESRPSIEFSIVRGGALR